LVEVNSVNVILDSKEGVNGPKLVVTHDGIPKNAESKDISPVTELTLYPNPASEYVNMDLSKCIRFSDITVTSIFGVQVENIITDNQNYQLDISGYTTGIYYITVEDNNGTRYTGTVLKY